MFFITITQALRYIDISTGPERTYPYQIKCPFHKAGHELNPSARVYPDTNTMYCWACHKAYSPLTLISTYHGISTREAMVMISEKFGPITTTKSNKTKLDVLLYNLISCVQFTSNPEINMRKIDQLLVAAGKGESELTLIPKVKTLTETLWKQAL